MKVAVECVGVFGKLFGHKYFKADYDRPFPYCVRCGVPVGSVLIKEVKEQTDE